VGNHAAADAPVIVDQAAIPTVGDADLDVPAPDTAAGLPVPSAATRVAVTFDPQMRRSITWSGTDQATVIASDPAVHPGIRVGGADLVAFSLDPTRTTTARVMHPELGAAQEIVAVGRAERVADGVKVEREVRVLLPDRHPDALVSHSTFRNLGLAPLRVEGVYTERLLLDRSLAEPGQAPHAFASYQGAAYAWGKDYALIPLTPGFRQSNFMGEDDVRGPEGVGGGMPLIDVWGRTMGVAVAHVEKGPRWVSLPVQVRPDGKVEIGLLETPQARLGQKSTLAPGEAYQTVTSALIFHRGDFSAALASYGELLRDRGVAIPRQSPASAHEPYWKSWGFRKDVTVDRFMARLPELKAMGIRTANLDDGWYDFLGDWQPNRAPGKFPGGAPDVISFVQRVHAEGFRTAIWWYPLGASPASRLAQRTDLLVMDQVGRPTTDIDGLHQLCPAHEPARRQIRDVLRRMVVDWGFDGVYLDFQGLSAVPPCFNPAHRHASPLDGFETLPLVFQEIHADLHQYRPDPFLEVCVCALPHSPYIMPFFPLATASDPRSDAQARRRVKAEKAIRGPRFAVGDAYQVPADEWTGTSLREGFETAMGTGAALTTFYADLDARQLALWQRWFGEYRAQGPGSGEYLDLYDLAFDRPEGHLVRRGDDLYYGFFAATWERSQAIELRGLVPGRRYQVQDYGRGMSLGEVTAGSPFVNVAFQGSLLLRVRPAL
jgi:alpha-galactosidase